jgi:hypothetical protein
MHAAPADCRVLAGKEVPFKHFAMFQYAHLRSASQSPAQALTGINPVQSIQHESRIVQSVRHGKRSGDYRDSLPRALLSNHIAAGCCVP